MDHFLVDEGMYLHKIRVYFTTEHSLIIAKLVMTMKKNTNNGRNYYLLNVYYMSGTLFTYIFAFGLQTILQGIIITLQMRKQFQENEMT